MGREKRFVARRFQELLFSVVKRILEFIEYL